MMKMNQESVVIGGIYLHPDRIRYRVDKVTPNTTGWEISHKFAGHIVDYTQLDQGDYPPGTEWRRSLDDFLNVFEFMKPVRIGVVGYCPPTNYDEEKALRCLEEAFNRIEIDFPKSNILIVSGVTNVGVLAQAYKLATERGFGTGGVACEKATHYDLFSTTERPVIVGQNWGDESTIFINGIKEIAQVDPNKVAQYSDHPHYGLDALIRIGVGPQSMREAEMMTKMGKVTYEFDLPKLN